MKPFTKFVLTEFFLVLFASFFLDFIVDRWHDPPDQIFLASFIGLAIVLYKAFCAGLEYGASLNE